MHRERREAAERRRLQRAPEREDAPRDEQHLERVHARFGRVADRVRIRDDQHRRDPRARAARRRRRPTNHSRDDRADHEDARQRRGRPRSPDAEHRRSRRAAARSRAAARRRACSALVQLAEREAGDVDDERLVEPQVGAGPEEEHEPGERAPRATAIDRRAARSRRSGSPAPSTRARARRRARSRVEKVTPGGVEPGRETVAISAGRCGMTSCANASRLSDDGQSRNHSTNSRQPASTNSCTFSRDLLGGADEVVAHVLVVRSPRPHSEPPPGESSHFFMSASVSNTRQSGPCVRTIESKSRPISSQYCSSRPDLRTKPSMPVCQLVLSACRASMRSVTFSPPPPIQISGSCWIGFGSQYAPSNDEVLALERDGLLGPEPLDAPRRVSSRICEPRARAREREAVRLVLALVPTRADAEDQPAAGEHVDARGFLGEQARVAVRRARDHLAELDRGRVLRERGERA